MNHSLFSLRVPRGFPGLALALAAMLAVAGRGALDLSKTQATSAKQQQLEKARENLLGLPLHFEENRGQTDPAVKFMARGPGYNLFLSTYGPVLSLERPVSTTPGMMRLDAVGLDLVGRNPSAAITSELPLKSRSNYLVGRNRSGWLNGLRNYGKVRYSEVYPGIDAVYYGNQRRLEYDFVVKPGSDPSLIQLRFLGPARKALPVEIRGGELKVHVSGEDLVQHRPIVYQMRGNRREPVDAKYVRLAGGRIGFDLGRYDRTRKLIIDPVLTYSSFVGGGLDDYGTDIAVDSTGAAYITGITNSHGQLEQDGPFQQMPRYPVCPFVAAFPGPDTGITGWRGDPDTGRLGVDYTTPPDGTPDCFFTFGRGDAFIFKMNPAGNGVIYSTYVGGESDDFGMGIAVDDQNQAYITGKTFSNLFPLLQPVQALNGGNGDAFVFKLNAQGTAPIYSTYLGGDGTEWGTSIALDPNRNAVVTGLTSSLNLPIFRAAQPAFGGGARDQFVAAINAIGTAFNYVTYWGGTGDEGGYGPYNWVPEAASINFIRPDFKAFISGAPFGPDFGAAVATDPLGNVFITGGTNSTNLPTNATVIQPAPAGGNDAFVTKFNPFGVPLFTTYLGGSGDDGGRDIAVNRDGEIFVTGYTDSVDFRVTPGVYQRVLGGNKDAFLTRLNTGGTSVVYSTYLGGSGEDVGEGIAINGSNNAYIAGFSKSANFPIRNQLQGTLLGPADAFLTKFHVNASGLEYSTYLGGTPDFATTGVDIGQAVAVDPNGVAYITGYTYNVDFPTTLNSWDQSLSFPTVAGRRSYNYGGASPSLNGGYYPLVDAFISRIANPPLAPSNLQVINVTQTSVTLSWEDNADNETGFEIERKQGSGNFVLIDTVGPNVLTYANTGLIPGTLYTYRVRAINNEGNSAYSNQVAITTLPDPPAAPIDLVATAIDRTRIRLTWADKSNNEESFQIERRRLTSPSTNFAIIATVGENVVTYDDTGLTSNTTYEYRVRAINVAGPSAYSNTASATTLPDPPSVAPTNVTATPVSDSQIDVKWEYAPTDATGFKIERSDDNGVSFRVIRQTTDPAVKTFSDTNLSGDTLYIYRVRAYNISGDGPPSAEVSARTLKAPPSGPVNLVARLAAPDQVKLDWTDTSNVEDGYKIYRSRDNFQTAGVLVAEVGPNVVTFTDTGLQRNTTFYYQVRGFTRNAGGDSLSDPSNTASIATLPVDPSGLTATATRDTEIRLTWQDNNPAASDNPVSFIIERSTDNFATNVQTAGTTTGAPGAQASFVDTGLQASTTYWYRVRAFNASGESGNSNVASATTLAPPPIAPSNLRVTTPPLPQGRTTLVLTWNDNSSDETAFAIERAPAIAGAFSEIARVGANITSFTDTGLNPDTEYFYRVRAIGPAGLDSTYSNVASGRTLPNPPSAPTNLQVTTPAPPAGIDTLVLNWSDSNTNETAFRIERSTDGANFVEVATVGADITTYTDQGLSPNTTYFYRVRAESPGGLSEYSNIASSTTMPALPDAPQNLRATVLSQTEIRLNWTDGSVNEDGFSIERSVDGLNFAPIATVGPNAETFTDTGLTANTTYTYRVRAFNVSGFSGYSNEARATTAPGVAQLILEVGSVKGGKKVKATVVLAGPAPAGGLVVNLFSDSPSAIVPAQLNIPAGSTTGQFVIRTRRVRTTTVATISAEAGGISASAQLEIRGRGGRR